jgi:hypothetical protein
MRKMFLIAAIVGVAAVAFHPAARADTLSDWIASLFSWGVNDGRGGVTPNDGPGSGTGVADSVPAPSH